MDDDLEVYASFWIYLAYFFSFIFFVMGYMNNMQNYIYYGLFFLIIGLCMLLSFKMNKVIKILEDKEEDYVFYEDSD